MAVMRLDDLYVIFCTQRACDLPRQRDQQVDPKAHIARAYDVAARGDFSQGGKVGIIETRGADDMCHPGLSGPRSQRHGRIGRSKVDDHVAGRKGCVNVIGHDQTPRGTPHGLPKVLPDPAMPGTLDRSRKHRAGLFVRRLHQHLPHAPPRHQKTAIFRMC